MSPTGVYRSFASYYDAYVGDFRGDFNIYLSLLHPGARPLEIGCGTGRLLKPALEQGYHITGIDISDDMLDRAREKLGGYIEPGQLSLLKHNLVDAPLSECYDPVWVSFYTFNYLLDQEEACTFLANLRKSMSTGAALIMDLFCPTTLLHPEMEGLWIQREITVEGRTLILRDSRALQGSIEKRIQVYEGAEGQEEIVTLRRFWNKQEIAELLGKTGFGDIQFTDGYDAEGFHPLSPAENTATSFVVKACSCKKRSGEIVYCT